MLENNQTARVLDISRCLGTAVTNGWPLCLFSRDIPMSVSVLVALDTQRYEILSRIIAQAAPGLNVMDLQTLDTSARLATPAVSL